MSHIIWCETNGTQYVCQTAAKTFKSLKNSTSLILSVKRQSFTCINLYMKQFCHNLTETNISHKALLSDPNKSHIAIGPGELKLWVGLNICLNE